MSRAPDVLFSTEENSAEESLPRPGYPAGLQRARALRVRPEGRRSSANRRRSSRRRAACLKRQWAQPGVRSKVGRRQPAQRGGSSASSSRFSRSSIARSQARSAAVTGEIVPPMTAQVQHVQGREQL